MKNENPKSPRELTRRDFVWLAAGALGASVALPLIPEKATAAHHEEGEGEAPEAAKVAEAPELVTDVESNALLLSQVKYVPVSEIEGKQCANCVLLIQRDGDYGRCGLFQKGAVPVTAWCTSWIQKAGV
jgi:hypothetical protein